MSHKYFLLFCFKKLMQIISQRYGLYQQIACLKVKKKLLLFSSLIRKKNDSEKI
tara:strand:+ start:61 stop:222 length:162 start_codon:yes stop_codon:yes gene_type:complete